MAPLVLPTSKLVNADIGTPEATVRKFLSSHPSVQVIITQWVDLCGIVKSRLLPVQSFLKLVASGGYLNNSPVDLLVPSTQGIVPEIFEVFSDRGKIIPDLSSLKVAVHDGSEIGNAAVVFAHVDYLRLDARANLKKIVEKAIKDHVLTFLVGIELEVCFMKPDSLELAGPAKPGVGNYSTTYRSVIWPILNEVALALSEVGIDIEQIIKEFGPSQWEVALPPLPPLQAVDAYVYAREVIKNIAHKHGIVATFYPVLHSPGSSDANKETQTTGQHIHISATPIRESADWDPDTVMAGILSHLPSLMAVGLAQLDSYARVGVAGMKSGGYLGWGDNHRDMPIRRITKNHWEIRTHDATANPYAMVAGLIAAALDRKPLTIKGASSESFKILSRYLSMMVLREYPPLTSC